MPNYEDLKRLILDVTPSVTDIIINKLPKDYMAGLALILAFLSLGVSILIPIISYCIHKKRSAQQLRMLIIAYIKSLIIKVDIIIADKKWSKKTSFEDYNRKNYEILESFLNQIHLLSNNEENTYIDFIIKFKTSDEMNLKNNLNCLIEFKSDLNKVMNVINRNIGKKKT